jgi:hypothetical protein
MCIFEHNELNNWQLLFPECLAAAHITLSILAMLQEHEAGAAEG